MVELERRCAVMNENYANDMGIKLKQINLTEDEKYFHKTFLTAPITPPPLTSSSMLPTTMAPPAVPASFAMAPPLRVGTPAHSLNLASGSNNAIDYQAIPRTLSMPPSYDSQGATGDDIHIMGHGSSVGSLSNAPFAMALDAGAYHSRQCTAAPLEIPSQP